MYNTKHDRYSSSLHPETATTDAFTVNHVAPPLLALLHVPITMMPSSDALGFLRMTQQDGPCAALSHLPTHALPIKLCRHTAQMWVFSPAAPQSSVLHLVLL